MEDSTNPRTQAIAALAGTTGDGDFDFPPPSTIRSSRSSRQPTSLTSNRKPISAARR